MNCQAFDKAINDTFEHHGLGVDVQLYAATDTPSPNPPFDWITVTVVVTPVVKDPMPSTEIWHFGGVVRITTHPGRPLGVLPIDRARLVGACKALEAIEQLPHSGPLPVKEISCTLTWPLVPGVAEPVYAFTWTEGGAHLLALVGGYSGQVLNSHPVMDAAA